MEHNGYELERYEISYQRLDISTKNNKTTIILRYSFRYTYRTYIIFIYEPNYRIDIIYLFISIVVSTGEKNGGQPCRLRSNSNEIIDFLDKRKSQSRAINTQTAVDARVELKNSLLRKLTVHFFFFLSFVIITPNILG